MAKKKHPPQQAPTQRRRRRGIDERIAALEAKIAAVKEREARRHAKADPTLRYAAAALRSIDKARVSTNDAATQKILSAARASVESVLNQASSAPASAPIRLRRSAGEIEHLGDALFAYLRSNPGQRGQQIAEALCTDMATIRPAMKRLIEAGKVKTEGQRRGMTYEAV